MRTTGKNLAAILSLLIVIIGVAAIYYFQNEQTSKLSEKAVILNNTLVQAQRTTIDTVGQLDDKLTNAKSKSEAIEFIDNAIILVNFELQKIGNIEEVENSTNFKNSAGELLMAYKKLLENQYKVEFIDLLYNNKDLSGEEYTNQVAMIFNDANTEIESLNREFLKQQIEFAKSYNLTIQ